MEVWQACLRKYFGGGICSGDGFEVVKEKAFRVMRIRGKRDEKEGKKEK